MPGPLISVIMPVYNSERFVVHAIRSVLDQHWQQVELLIVDDGSTDRSIELIAQITDARIRAFKQEHQGVCAARNLAMANMEGEYFCFLDSDDIMPRTALVDRMKVMLDRPEVHFVDGMVQTVSEDLSIIESSYVPSFSGWPLPELLTLSSSCFFGQTWLIRHLPDMKYSFDEDMTHAEDLLFLVSIAHSGQYTYVKTPVLLYRRHAASSMRDLDGLYRGYRSLYLKLLGYTDLIEFDPRVTWNKIKSIMAKSYIKKGKLMAGAKVYFAKPPRILSS